MPKKKKKKEYWENGDSSKRWAVMLKRFKSGIIRNTIFILDLKSNMTLTINDAGIRVIETLWRR